MPETPFVDVHQHLWPEAFIAELVRRAEPPCLHGSTLELVEGSYEIDLGAHELGVRLDALDRDGVDIAIVSLQPTLGLWALPDDERERLVTVWEEGVLEIVAKAAGRLAPLAAGPARAGFVGATVAAAALLDLDALTPTVSSLERDGGFLFVHPGATQRRPGAPAWWPALVDYPAQMQAAYLEWLHRGQERWPDLKVVFAILAGGGPVQLERLASRGVDVRSLLHSNVFFDTASYGRRAVELCIETFGVEQLVYGSDAPVVDTAAGLRALKAFGESVESLITNDNPNGLLP